MFIPNIFCLFYRINQTISTIAWVRSPCLCQSRVYRKSGFMSHKDMMATKTCWRVYKSQHENLTLNPTWHKLFLVDLTWPGDPGAPVCFWPFTQDSDSFSCLKNNVIWLSNVLNVSCANILLLDTKILTDQLCRIHHCSVIIILFYKK